MLPNKPIVIIKTGSTFPTIKQQLGDFEDWIVAVSGFSVQNFSVIDGINCQNLPAMDAFSGTIITGSPAMVTDQDEWIRRLADWMSQVLTLKLPLLGICFGHQLLAHAMGGVVAYHPGGREIGTKSIHLTPEGKLDPLFGALPDLFMAHTTHAQTVSVPPNGAQVLASNSFEHHHAFRLGQNAWGVQFHPEFTEDIMNKYVIEQSHALHKEGYDVERLQSSICTTNDASKLIKSFVEFVKNNVR